MASSADIIKALREALKDPNGPNQPTIGTVTSVDLTNNTCYVEPIDPVLPDFQQARLMTDINTGFLIIPAIESQVTVISLGQGDSQIIQYSALQSMQLNGLIYGGLVQITPLVAKLNALEVAFNDLLLAFNTHTHGGVTTGTSLTAIPTTIDPDPPLVLTVQPELENITVSHGNGT